MAHQQDQVTVKVTVLVVMVIPISALRILLLMPLSATSGMKAIAPMVIGVSVGTSAELAQMLGSQVRNTKPYLTRTVGTKVSKDSNEPTLDFSFKGGGKWSTQNFIEAHRSVIRSGKHNFEGARIPIPTSIRYDRLRDLLGVGITAKETRTLELLEFGMPLDCNPSFGCRKQQKNHHSALSFKSAIDDFIAKATKSQAILGPFEVAPIAGLCFSPIMSVPKDDDKRRVIVDFSYPSGSSINDGIPPSTYLGDIAEYNLPSVQAMVDRVNELGQGCLLFKRDLKGAFRQFSIDPGDYRFTGLLWNGKVFVDTKLAMGLRSAAFCCQAVTEIVAKIAGRSGHVLVYLDDFGGAESGKKAQETFDKLGELLSHVGLEEAREKAIPPSTRMDWLGISFDTEEWTIALKPGKLDQLLDWLPRLLKMRRVRKVFLQKILGNLVWASAVVRAGVIFFNRLLCLLRKLKRPNHSIHFSIEAKKDVSWWIDTLRAGQGKSAIPPAVWTPLTAFSTDASLEGFGMVWGSRAIAGIFTSEYDELDISKKEMLAVMAAIKHWFADLAGLRVKIFCDNQACVALLNNGIARSPFLATCLREIQFYLGSFNIEIKAEYIQSKQNVLADICSRAFSEEIHYNNFKKLLNEGTLVLDSFSYDKFKFEYMY